MNTHPLDFLPFEPKNRDLNSLRVIIKSMKNFFERHDGKIFGLKDADTDTLLFRVMPRFFMEILRKYFRLEVEGIEHIPKDGSVLITPNHSGYSGFDAFVLAHEIHREIKRIPRVLTHHLWFLTKTTAIPAQKLGFVEATTKNGLKYLKKKQPVILFPEGEHGNFKTTATRMYRLQEFKRGFIRMAIETQTPIVPTLVIGAEETHINLKELKLTKFLRGTILPIPLNVIPLPAKWKVIFMEPIYLPYHPSEVSNRELVHEIAQEIREKMQDRLTKELSKRKNVFT